MELDVVYIKPDELKHHERVRKQSSVYFARKRTQDGMDVIYAADVWFQKLPLLKAVVLDSAPRTDDGPRADENDWERIVYSIKIVGEVTEEELAGLQTGHSTSGYGTTRYYVNGQLHRDGDLPAVINVRDGLEEWWFNGVQHRDGGLPALVGAPSTYLPAYRQEHREEWWVHGVHERGEDLSATVVRKSVVDGIANSVSKLWCQGGVLHRDGDQPALVTETNGVVVHQEWWRHGQRHRDAGPAFITVERLSIRGEQHWYANNKFHRGDGLPAKIAGVSSQVPNGTSVEWFWHGAKMCDLVHYTGGPGPARSAISWFTAGLFYGVLKIADWDRVHLTRLYYPTTPLGPFRELEVLLPLRLEDRTLLENQEFAYEITAHARWDRRAAAVWVVLAAGIRKLPEGVIAFL
jgi:hypothetical protein